MNCHLIYGFGTDRTAEPPLYKNLCGMFGVRGVIRHEWNDGLIKSICDWQADDPESYVAVAHSYGGDALRHILPELMAHTDIKAAVFLDPVPRIWRHWGSMLWKVVTLGYGYDWKKTWEVPEGFPALCLYRKDKWFDWRIIDGHPLRNAMNHLYDIGHCDFLSNDDVWQRVHSYLSLIRADVEAA